MTHGAGLLAVVVRCVETRAFGLLPSLAQCRGASHALLCRRSYAECHTVQMVSRDGGSALPCHCPQLPFFAVIQTMEALMRFRPAVPLPAVAILSHALLFGALTCAFRKA